MFPLFLLICILLSNVMFNILLDFWLMLLFEKIGLLLFLLGISNIHFEEIIILIRVELLFYRLLLFLLLHLLLLVIV